MKHKRFALSGGLAICATLLIGAAGSAASLQQIGNFSLDGVKGRIDHLTYDSKNHRLFVAARGNNTVEVLDSISGKMLKTIRGEQEPQGVKFLQDESILVVATGEGGSIDFFDSNNFSLVKRLSGYRDADNIRYDSSAKQLIIGWGESLTTFTPKGEALATIKLPGHPESFQIQTSRQMIFVNVPSKNRVLGVDIRANKVVDTWAIQKASSSYSMCLDPDGEHLFVASRQPASIITYDCARGKEISRVESAGDADDLFYDPDKRRLYESCGEGFIDTFQDDGQGNLQRIEHLATAAGARTCLYVKELNRIFLAVPLRSKQQCEIRVFKVL